MNFVLIYNMINVAWYNQQEEKNTLGSFILKHGMKSWTKDFFPREFTAWRL